MHSFYFRIKKRGIWGKMMADLVKKSHLQAGKNAGPTYGLIDS
jgi:hypothetical protein